MKINPRNQITPFLWLDAQAEEAANFYVSLFADSKVVQIARWASGTMATASASVVNASASTSGSRIRRRDVALVCATGIPAWPPA